jgi:hypothetical protein
MGFEALTAVRMMMLFFWVLVPYRLIGRYQRFGETYFLHFQACLEDGDNMFLRNAGIYRRVYTTQNPRRTSSYEKGDEASVSIKKSECVCHLFRVVMLYQLHMLFIVKRDERTTEHCDVEMKQSWSVLSD